VHPPIGVAWFSNVIVPDGPAEPGLDVTVAINVTP
jgi:hypothetical protein